MLLLCTEAQADPRWWQHDFKLPGSPGAKTHPDIAVADVGGGTSTVGAIAVVWEQPSTTPGKDIWLLASFDRGCTWCAAKRWTQAPADETLPRVEVGVLGSKISFQVVYEREDQVWVSGAPAVDLGAALPCDQLAAVPIPTPIKLSRVLGAGERDTRPRIADVSNGTYLHFHATWQRVSASPGGSIEYAHDLSGLGSAWSTSVNVSTLISAPGTEPDIATDTLSTLPLSDSAATIFFRSAASGIRATRSADSGNTWVTPTPVSDGGALTAPAADSSTGPFNESDAWNGCVWQAANSPRDISMDAADQNGPASRFPDFGNPGDEAVSNMPPTPGLAPAIAIAPAQPGAGLGQNLMWNFWTDETPPLKEIVSRNGVLDAFNARPRNLDRLAFPAERVAPADPPASVVERFSNCAWSDGWPTFAGGTCATVARGGGSVGAVDVAAADALRFGNPPAEFFAVFADDRTGTSEIYFKRTDASVADPAIASAAGVCSAFDTRAISVQFQLLDECGKSPLETEKIDRYLLYHGSATTQTPPATANGPFLTRIVQPNDGTTALTVTGYGPGEQVHFWLLAEDQARNISPANFDPRVGTNSSISGRQKASAFMPTCRPVVVMDSCTFDNAACSPAPSHGAPARPGETVSATIRLLNTGDLAATDLTGIINASNATVIDPPGGDLGPLRLTVPLGGSPLVIPIKLKINATVTCPANVLITLQNVASNAGLATFGILDCPSPIATIDCSTSCTSVCSASGLAAGRQLLAVKETPPVWKIRFRWATDPSAAEYHVNSVTAKTQLVDPVPHLPPRGSGLARCTAIAPTVNCLDTVPLASGDLYFQLLTACGPTAAEEGPL